MSHVEIDDTRTDTPRDRAWHVLVRELRILGAPYPPAPAGVILAKLIDAGAVPEDPAPSRPPVGDLQRAVELIDNWNDQQPVTRQLRALRDLIAPGLLVADNPLPANLSSRQRDMPRCSECHRNDGAHKLDCSRRARALSGPSS